MSIWAYFYAQVLFLDIYFFPPNSKNLPPWIKNEFTEVAISILTNRLKCKEASLLVHFGWIPDMGERKAKGGSLYKGRRQKETRC